MYRGILKKKEKAVRHDPVFFTDHSSAKASYAVYSKMTKAQWADAFCSLFVVALGDRDPMEILKIASRHATAASLFRERK